jgi:hypothetical protein
MQRVRMSLSYFKDFGWEADVVTVDPAFSDISKDQLLLSSIQNEASVHFVKALPKKWTSKLGLGSIALRSLWFYRRKVDQLLMQQKYDLIFFSTTQYPVCILGPYWKRKFNIPYVIDMQDPWHSDYYMTKPKHQRPPKYWFSYRLNKTLEPIAMKKVDGLISVSSAYLQTLNKRYQNCNSIPQQTITFGAFDKDLQIAFNNKTAYPSVLPKKNDEISIVYIGRGGLDMSDAVQLLFKAFNQCLEEDKKLFENFRFYFIGTSYAAAGKGTPTIYPLAQDAKVSAYVTEFTDRIPFYQALNTLADASALFIPGSNDAQYTASKIYPYVMLKKPLLALFHPDSSVVSFLDKCKVGNVYTFNQGKQQLMIGIKSFLHSIARNTVQPVVPVQEFFEQYSAKAMTQKQCDLFNEVVK